MATIAMQVSNIYQVGAAMQIRRRKPSELEAAISAGYFALAKSLVRQAIRDALQQKNAELREEAAAWLGSENGLYFAELVGMDARIVKEWYLAGCPAKVGEND